VAKSPYPPRYEGGSCQIILTNSFIWKICKKLVIPYVNWKIKTLDKKMDTLSFDLSIEINGK
jgi:hypothetical protein